MKWGWSPQRREFTHMRKNSMVVSNALRKWFVVVLLIGLLGACSSADSPPSTAPPSDTESEPTAAPTAPPPTPTPTPVPPPPTPTATATPEQTEGRLETQASGACANPFYPIRDDWVWTYRTFAAEALASEYTQSYTNVSAEGFTNIVQLEGATVEAAWLCSEEGLISSEYASIALTSVPDLSFETLDYSGIYLLPADQWALNATWETTYDVRTAFTVEGMSVETDMSVVMQNEIVAIEEVTVPAGTYPEAYRVDAYTTMDMSMSGISTSMDFMVSQWFVRGVGLVKSSSTYEGMTSGIELVSLEPK